MNESKNLGATSLKRQAPRPRARSKGKRPLARPNAARLTPGPPNDRTQPGSRPPRDGSTEPGGKVRSMPRGSGRKVWLGEQAARTERQGTLIALLASSEAEAPALKEHRAPRRQVRWRKVPFAPDPSAGARGASDARGRAERERARLLRGVQGRAERGRAPGRYGAFRAAPSEGAPGRNGAAAFRPPGAFRRVGGLSNERALGRKVRNKLFIQTVAPAADERRPSPGPRSGRSHPRVAGESPARYERALASTVVLAPS